MVIENEYFLPAIIIPNELATWGAGDEGWDNKRCCYRLLAHNIDGEKWHTVDCRNDMEDGPGNPLWLYKRKISEGLALLDKYGKVLICCTAGISRSNSIAAGILMEKYKMDYYDALGTIKDKVKWAMIEQAHLNALKELYPPRIPLSESQ